MRVLNLRFGLLDVACGTLTRRGTFVVVLAAAMMSGQRAHAQPGTVLSHQKISATEGGFTGILDIGDAFGRSAASLGDLDGDGVGDMATQSGCPNRGCRVATALVPGPVRLPSPVVHLRDSPILRCVRDRLWSHTLGRRPNWHRDVKPVSARRSTGADLYGATRPRTECYGTGFAPPGASFPRRPYGSDLSPEAVRLN